MSADVETLVHLGGTAAVSTPLVSNRSVAVFAAALAVVIGVVYALPALDAWVEADDFHFFVRFVLGDKSSLTQLAGEGRFWAAIVYDVVANALLRTADDINRLRLVACVCLWLLGLQLFFVVRTVLPSGVAGAVVVAVICSAPMVEQFTTAATFAGPLLSHGASLAAWWALSRAVQRG